MARTVAIMSDTFAVQNCTAKWAAIIISATKGTQIKSQTHFAPSRNGSLWAARACLTCPGACAFYIFNWQFDKPIGGIKTVVSWRHGAYRRAQNMCNNGMCAKLRKNAVQTWNYHFGWRFGLFNCSLNSGGRALFGICRAQLCILREQAFYSNRIDVNSEFTSKHNISLAQQSTIRIIHLRL